MPPIPDRIQAELLEHELKILRVEAGTRKKILAMLMKLGKDLTAEILGSGIDTPRTDWQRARLRKLLEAVSKKIGMAYQGIGESVQEDLAGLAQVSSEGIAAAVNAAIGAKLVQPLDWTPRQLASLASNVMIEGAPSAEWWARQSEDMVQGFMDQMRMGLLRGEGIDKLRDRILPKTDLRTVPMEDRGLIWKARRNAEALVRTSAIACMNDAHLATYNENLDVISGVQWVSTLDNRTTPICRVLDGLIWDLPDMTPRGHGRDYPGASAHWNCRSARVPVTRTWEELAQNKRLARELDKIKPGDRASMGGQVSGDLTYETWFETLSRPRQEEILGPVRYDLWKRGQIGFTDMVDQTGRELTVKELLRK